MALSAEDVHDKQFKLVRQSTGYDIDEVDAFLDEVEAEIARLTAELEQARAAAGTAQGASSGPGEPSVAAARILELAQRTADEFVAEARREADALTAQVGELEARAAALRGFEAQVRARLAEYFETQLRDLRATEAHDS